MVVKSRFIFIFQPYLIKDTANKRFRMRICPVCDGDGECRNEFHDATINLIVLAVEVLSSKTCPECGEEYATRGKCSTCGGTGEVED